MQTLDKIEVVQVKNAYFAVENWNGECWLNSWRVVPIDGDFEVFENDETDSRRYCVRPVFDYDLLNDEDIEDENADCIIGYELCDI